MSAKSDKIKKHFKDHKEAYITGGICLVVGAAVTYLVVKGHSDPELDESIKLINTITGDHNTIITQIVRRGHPGDIVRCIETGEVFASKNRAAAMNGISATALRNHLSGLTDSVKGLTFENLGEAV